MQNLWNNSTRPSDATPLDQLVAMSRLIGYDPELVVWGGGNTSVKVWEADFRGRQTYVLRIKGSGSDLKKIEAKHFAGVRMDDVLPLESRADMSDEEMVDYLAQTLMNPKDPRPSIETLLHAFIPATAVAHSHADAILALINNVRGAEHVRECFGSDVVAVPYRRPGFLLSKEVGEAVRTHPEAIGVILMNHGLITWGSTCKEAYARHIDLVTRAEEYVRQRQPADIRPAQFDRNGWNWSESAARIVPILRGAISKGGKRVLLGFTNHPDIMDFVDSPDAERISQIGAATPDHILTTKVRPLFIRLPENGDAAPAINAALDIWRAEYVSYYERNKTAINAPMLEANPRVVLIPGVGMFTTGKDLRAAWIPSDIYHHTVSIINRAESLGGYKSLDEPNAALAEYWPLELYKLTNAPPEQELSRKVALITGAGSGIGKAIAELFAANGAYVIVCDNDVEKADSVLEELDRKYPGRLESTRMDVTNEEDVAQAFEITACNVGGIDIVVSNAGIAPTGRIEELSRETWDRSFAVNATGHFLVAREAVKMMRAQGIGGSIIFTVTKNVPAPGAEFGAYSCAKAAEAQLCRILAIENGKNGIRCNMINPDAVFEASLWTPELIADRAKAQGIEPEQVPDFYRKRSLLQLPVTGEDVAQAALFFASDRSAKTTGAILPVDGGVREAFLR